MSKNLIGIHSNADGYIGVYPTLCISCEVWVNELYFQHLLYVEVKGKILIIGRELTP